MPNGYTLADDFRTGPSLNFPIADQAGVIAARVRRRKGLAGCLSPRGTRPFRSSALMFLPPGSSHNLASSYTGQGQTPSCCVPWHRHSGAALSVAEPCMSSNASLRLNFCFVHRLSTITLHEKATTASNHPRAPARTKSLRLVWPRMPCQASLRPLPAASTPTTSRCNYRAQPPTATSQIIRTCSTIYKTHRAPVRGGFLQVAVSEAPVHST